MVSCTELPVLASSRASYHGSSIKSCDTSSLLWSSQSRCSLRSVLASPVIQAPCTRLSYHGQFYQVLLSWSSLLQFCVASSLFWPLLVHPIMVRSIKSCVASSSHSAILQPAINMVSCIKLPVLVIPITVLSSGPMLRASCSSQIYQAPCTQLSYYGQLYQVLCFEQPIMVILLQFCDQ